MASRVSVASLQSRLGFLQEYFPPEPGDLLIDDPRSGRAGGDPCARLIQGMQHFLQHRVTIRRQAALADAIPRERLWITAHQEASLRGPDPVVPIFAAALAGVECPDGLENLPAEGRHDENRRFVSD